jgi:hypothetical protein
MIGYSCCNNQEYYFYPYIWNDKKYAVEHGIHISEMEIIFARRGMALFSRKLRI